MRPVHLLYFIFVIFSTTKLYSQKVETIRIRKDPTFIYFFQKGIKSDTIANHSLFYLVVPDSLKKSVSVYLDNGQLITTANDSIVQLNYIQSLKYECIYVSKEESGVDPNSKRKSPELKTLVNGSSSHRLNEIFIRIINKAEDEVLLENTYYLKGLDKASK